MDVVIVGAGAAGIGAGLALQAAGVPFVMLEAADRVGGRAFTDRTSLPEAWDQGCHWLHCADVNPLVPWADRLGADVEKRDRMDASRMWIAGEWLQGARFTEADDAIGEAFEAAYAAAERGEETPLSAHLPQGGDADPFAQAIARLLTSADAEAVSTIGFARYADTEVNYAVRSGLGDLIARMASGLPLRLSTRVTRVDQGARGVRVVTPLGEISAKAAIVTASTNVLTSGAIAFGPEVRGVLDPMQEVPCGSYEKIAVALHRLPMDLGDTQFVWVDPGVRGLSFQVAPAAQALMIAHVGGSDATDLLAEGRAAMVALAVERLAEAFGSGIRAEVRGAAVTGWQANPLVRGAYSHTRPGRWPARDAMMAAETGDIVFAGEAFSRDWYATAHGAWQSGQDAARRVMRSLRFP